MVKSAVAIPFFVGPLVNEKIQESFSAKIDRGTETTTALGARTISGKAPLELLVHRVKVFQCGDHKFFLCGVDRFFQWGVPCRGPGTR